MPPPRCVNVTHRFSLSLPYIRRMNRYHYIIIRARSLLSGIASVFLNYHAPFSPPFFIFLSLSRTWNEKENVPRAERVISLYSSFSFVIKKKRKKKFPNLAYISTPFIVERGKSDVRTSGGQWRRPPNYSVNWCLIGIRWGGEGAFQARPWCVVRV